MTERIYSNNSNLSLFAQVFLATDWYDKEEAGLSVTTLIKPIRQTVLGKRVPPEARLSDIVDNVASANGSAIHDGYERAWKNPNLQNTLALLGVPPGLRQRIRVNPTPEQVAAGGIIACYTEIRSSMVIRGVKVSGKFDFCGDGVIEDLKNTSTYKYMNTDGEEYILQGSMYRLLNPDKVKKDWMNLTFNFTDWNKRDSFMKPDRYPQQKTLTKKYNLIPIADTLAWAEGRVELLLKHMGSPEEELPPCSDKDLWRTDPVYKFYSNAENAFIPGKRSTKNFDTRREADAYFAEKGSKGIVVEKPGEVKACLYCAGFHACKQKDALIASGDLVLS